MSKKAKNEIKGLSIEGMDTLYVKFDDGSVRKYRIEYDEKWNSHPRRSGQMNSVHGEKKLRKHEKHQRKLNAKRQRYTAKEPPKEFPKREIRKQMLRNAGYTGFMTLYDLYFIAFNNIRNRNESSTKFNIKTPIFKCNGKIVKNLSDYNIVFSLHRDFDIWTANDTLSNITTMVKECSKRENTYANEVYSEDYKYYMVSLDVFMNTIMNDVIHQIKDNSYLSVDKRKHFVPELFDGDESIRFVLAENNDIAPNVMSLALGGKINWAAISKKKDGKRFCDIMLNS